MISAITCNFSDPLLAIWSKLISIIMHQHYIIVSSPFKTCYTGSIKSVKLAFMTILSSSIVNICSEQFISASNLDKCLGSLSMPNIIQLTTFKRSNLVEKKVKGAVVPWCVYGFIFQPCNSSNKLVRFQTSFFMYLTI